MTRVRKVPLVTACAVALFAPSATVALADGPEEGGSPGTTLTVTPSDGLRDTATVTVTGSGYKPNRSGDGAGYLVECGAVPELNLDNCVDLARFTTDAAGNINAIAVTVTATFDPAGPDPVIDCRATTCYVMANTDEKNARHHLAFGPPGTGSTPRPDYDGDAVSDITVYRPSTGMWYVRRSTDLGTTAVNWGGVSGDVPVAGDYDGDGVSDITVYRPSTGMWYVRRSTDLGMTAVNWGGVDGDVPVAGDYDGDGVSDITVYRPSTGMWYVRRSTDLGMTAVNWGGVSGDVPVGA